MVEAKTIQTFTSELLEELFGPNVEKTRYVKLDLSDTRFCLEDLNNFANEPLLSKAKLKELDLSKNRLVDISLVNEANGFIPLQTLKARKNMICDGPDLTLRNLVELNLSFNDLVAMPPLKNLPRLECLLLAHNRISGTWVGLHDARALKVLDLSHNVYDFRPSQLEDQLRTLALLHQLTWLKVEGNLFCPFFEEYPVFFVMALRRLVNLDGVEITLQTRKEIETNVPLLSMDRYDDLYTRRKNDYEAKNMERPQEVADLRDLPLIRIVQRLQEALKDPTRSQVLVQGSCALLRQVYKNPTAQQDFFLERINSEEQAEQILDEFLHTASLLYDRYDMVQDEVLKLLAYASVIPKYGIAVKSIQTLGRFMEGAEEAVAAVLVDIVVPVLAPTSDNPDPVARLVSPIAIEVMKGLLSVGCPRLLRTATEAGFGTGLLSVVPHLRTAYAYLPDENDDDEMKEYQEAFWYITPVFAGLTSEEESGLIGASNDDGSLHKEVHRKILQELDNKALADNLSKRDLWLGILQLSENFSAHGGDEVRALYTKSALHVQLITRSKKMLMEMGGSQFTSIPTKVRETFASIFRCVRVMCAQSNSLLRDCCDAYHVLEIYIDVVKQHVMDPKMLTEGIRGIILALGDESLRRKYIPKVVEELSKTTPLLQYLEERKKFPDLYRQSGYHRGDIDEKEGAGALRIPPFKNLTCQYTIEAFRAIIEFFGFFMTTPEEPLCEVVNEALNGSSREMVLLQLLEIPDDNLRLAVMDCIAKVPLNQIENDEMNLLVKMLSDTRNIAAGENERILSEVVKQLIRMSQETGETGFTFRTRHAKMAIKEAFEILLRNSMRITYGNDEEEDQKLMLSLACVDFLVVASGIPELRASLRNEDTLRGFQDIVKNEDKLHSYQKEDLNLEQTWLGRELDNLITCVNDSQLSSTGKVRYRLLSRIADVLSAEGESEGRGFGVLKVAEIEARMWNELKLSQNEDFLDDESKEDRIGQVKNFVDADGIHILLKSLVDVASSELEKKYEKRYEEAQEGLSRITQEVKKKESEAGEKDEAQKAQEEPYVVSVMDAAGNERETAILINAENPDEEQEDDGDLELVPARDVLMFTVQTTGARIAAALAEEVVLFSITPDLLKCDESLFQHDPAEFPEMAGVAQKNYAFAAVLRSFYALLVARVADKTDADRIRDEALKTLRRPRTVHTVLALLDSLPPLPCNVAAKYFRICSHVFRMSVGRRQESTAMLFTFETIVFYAETLAQPLVLAMKNGQDRLLSSHEQILSTEIARATLVLVSTVPHMTFSEDENIQEEAVRAALERLVPDSLLRLFVCSIVYSLQATDPYGMCEAASEVLAFYMACDPRTQYPLIEALCSAQIFNGSPLRESFMHSFLEKMGDGLFANSTQKWLSSTHATGKQRLLLLARVLKVGFMPGVWEELLFVLTSKGAFLLKRPMIVSLFDPEWAFNPEPPTIIATYEYLKLHNIVHAGQLLSIEWESTWESLMCHRLIQAEQICDCLHFLSAPEMADRVRPERSHALDAAVKKLKIKGETICASFAYIVIEGIAGTPATKTMQYFVLTDIEFVRFNFDYKHASLQVVPFKPDEHDTSGLLSVIEQQKLKSLKQVVFGSDGNAVLDLDFGGVSRLEFFDDSAREQWRHGFNTVLDFDGGGWVKHKDLAI